MVSQGKSILKTLVQISRGKRLYRELEHLEIVNIVLSQLTKRFSATSYRKANSTVERRKKAFREQSNDQNFRAIFSKLVSSKDNKMKGKEATARQEDASVFRMLGSKKDETKGRDRD